MIWLLWIVLFHDEDPKILDRQPRFEGPAYRAHNRGLPPQFEAQNVELMSWLPLSEFGSQNNGNDCWGYTSPSGREYAILGMSTGTAFVEITDPGNAQIIEIIDGPSSLWRDIKTYQHYAYAVSEGGEGIQIIDLGQIDQGLVTLIGTVDTPGAANTHNVTIDTTSGFLYRCGGSGFGLRIYDLSNPAQPEYLSSWLDKYVHDAQAVTYTSGPYAGRQFVFACAGFNSGWVMTGLSIIDVTDKQNLNVLTHYEYSTPSYSHQGWLSPDRRLFYLNDELDEANQGTTTTTRILNVENLSQPFEVGTYTNGSTSIDHNLYTRDDFVYLANYRSGLRIYHAAADGLQEIAYFDTYPADNLAHFNGLWSTYPYFESGTVIGSDLERGLFVWRPQLTPPRGDLNGDWKVNRSDLDIAIGMWPSCPGACTADLNGNSRLDVNDLAELVGLMH